jgi:hypothetical protein
MDSIDELKGSGRAAVSLPRAGRALGVSESTGWRAIRDGTFPVQPIKVGHRILIPVAPLLRLLEGQIVEQDGVPNQSPVEGHG